MKNIKKTTLNRDAKYYLKQSIELRMPIWLKLGSKVNETVFHRAYINIVSNISSIIGWDF